MPVRSIAEVIGQQLNIPLAALAPEDAAEHFGWLGGFLAADVPASSALTRELVGWQPMNPGLIADLERDQYFKEAWAPAT